ncbi:MerR family transcriptional regulator [Paenibacillus albicereus]|uniref:MerR family transcriptional regulator n=1 Tax=Paenibacillus albicereus TaxID=2726185 RepID=A0A6H2GZ39_9BACL|nr:MerR family transcriptional regulator [Paenibacillus albicereus]QJC52680.1 MerR family transcriptional regulator [Paenibacillus albicereus]
MKANEVSRLTGLPISTLRFYERNELIPEPFISRDEHNYRVYREDVVAYLQDLKMLLALGFTIKELSLLISESSTEEKEELVRDKIIHIQKMEKQMKASKALLREVLEGKANFQTFCR